MYPRVIFSNLALEGFAVNFNKTDGKKASFEDYVKVVFKWHCKILKALTQCLESKEYMEVTKCDALTPPYPTLNPR